MKKFMPRHLEWNAILHLKKRGFKYYELGENYKIANEKFSKKRSQSEFKEKYGSECIQSFLKLKFRIRIELYFKAIFKFKNIS